MNLEIIVLIRLLFAHFLVDFVLQPDSWVEDRKSRGFHSIYLYLHSFLAGLFIYLFSGSWSSIWIFGLVFITHLLIDGVRAKFDDNFMFFILDQLGHLAIIFVIWLIIIKYNFNELINIIFKDSYQFVWLLLLAYLVALWPSGILINRIIKKWRVSLPDKEIEEESLANAGRYIGYLERILILTFILLNEYTAIGFLFTAKSIFRFRENPKLIEYFLIGTLLSFAIAFFIGLVTKWALPIVQLEV